MSFTNFKAIDFKAVDGQTPDDFYNCVVNGGINFDSVADVLGYSCQRNTLTGTESQSLTPPAGYTLTGISAERQHLFIVAVGTITLTISHYDTDTTQTVTNTFSLYGTTKFPAVFAVSYHNLVSVTLTGAAGASDTHTYSAYWLAEAEPTDARVL